MTQQLQNAVYELKLSDAFDIVSTNILVNKMSIENLTMQQKYLQLQANVCNDARERAIKKVELINGLNAVLEKQLNEFCEIRQEECQLLVEDINSLDDQTEESIANNREMVILHNKMTELIDKIEHLHAQIPEKVTVTNYRIKPNDQNIGTTLDPMV